ncbi:hypothetical protein [Roseibium sp. MMSF_3412]|uniref:hypothetical protein n=1 Tax=Roseibium sp. MMSF_3412 TaxID=3046712 RepID=UPI00273FF2A9|nr:hypothetical protein [Roseibium sp. MMSF_3412]
MQTTRHTIRNIDPQLLLEARILALQTDQRLGDIVNQALDCFIEDATSGPQEEDREEA